MKHKLIAFAGRKRCGKGTLSNAIKEYVNENNGKCIILTVANYLKFLCCDILEIDFDTLNQWKDDSNKILEIKPSNRWYNLINDKTNIPVDIIKKEIENITFTNVRQILQVIGTDLIRKYNPEWHINCLKKDIEDYIDTYTIVIDDVRFPNEKQAIEEFGGRVFFIIRPNYFNVSNHISETTLKWQDFKDENIIINDFDIKTFRIYIKVAFANNFDINLPIFLSNCNHFKINTNCNFPNNSSNKKLIEDILDNCLKDERFLKNGILHYNSPNRKYRNIFNEEVMLNDCNNWQRDFVIYNPLINENLKFYM